MCSSLFPVRRARGGRKVKYLEILWFMPLSILEVY
jgi:hypothetical protein